MNKRGATLVVEIGLWVVRLIMVVVIIMAVALQIRTYINARADMDIAEPALLVHVLGTSPAILQQDASGSVRRVVDIARFRQPGALDGQLVFAQRHMAAKLTLLEKDAATAIAEAYADKEYYNELAAQVPALLDKSVIRLERQWPVLMHEPGKDRLGVLRVEVLQPK